MTDLFYKTREFIKRSFNGNESQMKHFDRTVFWLEKLEPHADEGFRIAAVSHDIQRAFRVAGEGFDDKDRSFTDPETLRHHQEKGAEIMSKFLVENGAEKNLIERVKHHIEKHELGGDKDQNILKDADSLSFLENQAESFLNKLEEQGYENIKEKFDWMYERITDSKAKQIAKPFYEDMTQRLNQRRKQV